MVRLAAIYAKCVEWTSERLRWLRGELGDGWPRALAPAVVFFALLPFILPLLKLELNEPLFGDAQMMQYIAWGIRHGMKLYRDMGSADGPYIHFTQALIQIFLGQSDRALRVADIALQVLGSVLIGAMLAPRLGLSPLARGMSVFAWAATSVSIWLSYYLNEPWANTTEREAFYSVWGCASMVALYTSGTFPRRLAALLAFAGGFWGMSMCFGKPTCAIFFAAGALALLSSEPALVATRALRIRMALYGSAACVAFFVLGVLLFGSIRGYFFWCWELVLVGNKFVWRMDWLKLFLVQFGDMRSLTMLCVLVGGLAVGTRIMPARAVGFVIAPALHWLSFCLQARGYSYQAIPLLASATTLALVVVANLWQRGFDEPVFGVIAPITLVLIGYTAFGSLETSSYRWTGDPNQWHHPVNTSNEPEKRAGEYLKEHTKPDDRIFAYTVGPRGDNAFVVLFYAERRAASPFFYELWLDPLVILPESEVQPNKRELAALKAMQRRTRGETCSALTRHPPAAVAYVSFDRITAVCPRLRTMLERDYSEAKVIDDIHIYLRKPGGKPS
jgi:hypothetical protein